MGCASCGAAAARRRKNAALRNTQKKVELTPTGQGQKAPVRQPLKTRKPAASTYQRFLKSRRR